MTGPSGGPRKPETSTDVARKLPAPPRQPVASTPVLVKEEEEVLLQCEAAIETLKFAFWAAGKALQVIRQGRLYRATHETFEEYCQARWGMTRAQANKLIRMWPIAEALFDSQSNDLARARAKLSQAAIWELVPVAEQYDVTAAAHVYRTAEEAEETVTATIAKKAVQAVAALPESPRFDPEAATTAIRGALHPAPDGAPATPRKRRPRAEDRSSGTPDIETLLPWDSPAVLNQVLRTYMTPEDRHTLGKLLMEE
ncbi:hypothetical protein [Streptomyces sp. MP131-18]|uniref:hypothetical protein n=1 Tax=Streptomyces sp. MP131-18 TaxID=1857892 RepID=UPI00117D89DA|nr:hypothetical protein [Streptomyces sp. MP131-18]